MLPVLLRLILKGACYEAHYMLTLPNMLELSYLCSPIHCKQAESHQERADEAVRDAELALQAMQAVAGRTHPVMQSFWEALAKIKEAVSSPLSCLVD